MRNAAVEQTSNYWIKMCHIFACHFPPDFYWIPWKCKNFQRPEHRKVKYWNSLKLCCQKYKSISLKAALNYTTRKPLFPLQIVLLFAVELFVFHLKSSKLLSLCRRYQKIKKHCCLAALNLWQPTIQFKFFSCFTALGSVGGSHSINSFIRYLLWMIFTWELQAKRQSDAFMLWHLKFKKHYFVGSIEKRAKFYLVINSLKENNSHFILLTIKYVFVFQISFFPLHIKFIKTIASSRGCQGVGLTICIASCMLIVLNCTLLK